ncbi:MAG: hypothetical protein M3160_09625 [Candidatus Eremiobacteraeota bacterium]|nr:hypothetical protein [Candidatus Eremiobacteraeota bacterium]
MPRALIRHSAAQYSVPVVEPYRLDLTVDALRRIGSNVVDVVAKDGRYLRAFEDGTVIAARQRRPDAIMLSISGAAPDSTVQLVSRMLGANVQLKPWYRGSKKFPWLGTLSSNLRGLKPPRYPTLWEALAHAVIFQQISIFAAASIMRRVIELLAKPVAYSGVTLYPFPPAQTFLDCSAEMLRAAGLSLNKVIALHAIAREVVEGTVNPDQLTQLRGIGPWSAAVVRLRGLGDLSVFPLKDSGVARSVRLLSGHQGVDIDELLAGLGAQRGMLYYHLLLGRMRNQPGPQLV